ncbi:hypothetical protein Dimus_023706 [Dionaea muscipula]
MIKSKRVRLSHKSIAAKSDPFERLPDDLVICVLSNLCSSSSRPSDFINALIVCKRFNRLGLNQLVLTRAGSNLFAIRAKNWSESAHRFLKLCVNAGNVEACYILGMIRFYCLQNRGSGASLMTRAAISSHAPALYSLAVIQFNGSGGSKNEKDLRAGVALCARAAYLGHIDALRELGHCLQDGYGVSQNIPDGHRMLVQANAHELAIVFPSTRSASSTLHHRRHGHGHHSQPSFNQVNTRSRSNVDKSRQICALWRDYGCNVPDPEPHPVNRFLMEWFTLKGEGGEIGSNPRLCSYPGCGRPETRPHEFRRCSVCGAANYCSRCCQSRHWKLEHKDQCTRTEPWFNEGVDAGAGDGLGFGFGDGLVVGQGEIIHEPS